MDGLKFELVGEEETAGERVGAIIKVVGVGGCGCNIVNAMAEMGVRDADLIAVNTDIQSLRRVNVADKVQIGKMLTGGRGAEATRTERAAEEDRNTLPICCAEQTCFLLRPGWAEEPEAALRP